jgi:hypothetical protein
VVRHIADAAKYNSVALDQRGLAVRANLADIFFTHIRYHFLCFFWGELSPPEGEGLLPI